jgi:hypothetical protein
MAGEVPALLAGLALGLAFGATALHTNFCAMGAVTDILLVGDWRRFRAWMLAIAVALAGTQGLAAAGLVRIDDSIYLSYAHVWGLALLGGLAFGFGMVLTGGCVQRNLVRLGAGSLKALTVLVIFTACAAVTLWLFPLYLRPFLDPTTPGFGPWDLGGLVASLTGAPETTARIGLTAVVAGALIAFCLADSGFRGSGRNLAAGLILGALVPLGWLATTQLGIWRPDSLNFVLPLATSGLSLFAGGGLALFGLGAAAGVVVGAALAVLAGGSFRVETFANAADAGRHLVGAALMAVGGILALGCTVGQAMTGVSTLAIGSFLALLGIIGGAVCGLKYLEVGGIGTLLGRG